MHIVILGAAESGVGAALLAQAKGHTVFVSDRSAIADKYKQQLLQAGISFEENQHTEALVLAAHEIIKSPGIPEKAPIIQAVRQQAIPVISEIEFAGRYTQAKCICITGTNGKTTTTLLTYHLLKEAGLNVGLAGNVGYSLAAQVIEDKHEYYVIELSSFQLDDTHDFRPWISILLNITPDHLDRYDNSLEKYAHAKLRIIRNLDSTGHFIYNADDEVTTRHYQGAFLEASKLPFSMHHRPDLHLAAYYRTADTLYTNLTRGYDGRHGQEIRTNQSPLIGQHNRQNTLAATLAARIAGLSAAQIEAGFATFQNADHRLQVIAEINGVKFINDSKATNVEAAWYALDGIPQPIVWIAGGTDKGNDYNSLLNLAASGVKALICLGLDNEKLKAAFLPLLPKVLETSTMAAAVQAAAAAAAPGDVVLLSPCCASFDLFKNYEDRGQQFAEEVRKLAGSAKPPVAAKA